MPSGPILVAVISPQMVVERGLVDLLARHPDRLAVVPFRNGRDPDVVLFDLIDKHLSGLQRLLTSTSAKVLAVSRDPRPELARRALALGADGCLSIGLSESELINAVVAVAVPRTEGRSEVGAEVAPGGDRLSGAVATRLGVDVGLTSREVQVLTLIAQGRTNREIAGELFLSPNSIKTYVRTAYRKIGATSRSQAVAWAIRNGFPVDPC